MKRPLAGWKHGTITWAVLSCGGFSECNLATAGYTTLGKKTKCFDIRVYTYHS